MARSRGNSLLRRRPEAIGELLWCLDSYTHLVFSIRMDRRQRVSLLTEAALPDREHGVPSVVSAPASPVGVTKVRLPGGGSTRLMRVMQTNACSLSCGYCPTYCGGKVKRTALAPDEVAMTFMDLQRGGAADGLFLT